MYECEHKSLEEMLYELKVYGNLVLECSNQTNHKWVCKYTTKLNNKDYQFENSGTDLYEVLKRCMIAIERFPIIKQN